MITKHVVVLPYDEHWARDFCEIKSEIQEALDQLALAIEHVGSTSVHGLSAKPIIDIDVVIKDYSMLDAVISALERIDYHHEGNLGIAGREAFKYEGKTHLRKHHLYVCPRDSEELKRHIAFREYLRSHPEAVREYSRIKEEGAALYPFDIEKYIVQKFINVQIEEKKTKNKDGSRRIETKTKVIFPRYHQLDVVRKLVAHVRENGPGHNYLIQHSAGSGKSNSIAWTAHRMASLHNKDNEPIFNSVIIVTDRKVLDQQLQATVSSFDHTLGSVVTIDEKKSSQDLKNSINDGKRIIVTTLQKFPVIYDQVSDTSGKSFAIIVDEAHSSQTGQSAMKLKVALADTKDALEEYAEIEGKAEEDYHLAKTFEGAIELDDEAGSFGPTNPKKAGPKKEKLSPLDEIIQRINEEFMGEFTDADKVIVEDLYNRMKKDSDVQKAAQTDDRQVYHRSVFLKIFDETAMAAYTENQEAYVQLFQDAKKYHAVQAALADKLYNDLHNKK